MQRTHWLVIGVLCLVSALIRGNSLLSPLLGEEDYETESLQEGPALSSSLTSEEEWESYNEWRCYPRSVVELKCTEIEYDGWRKSPTIVVTAENQRSEYSLDPTFNWDCGLTLNEWQSLFTDSSEVCFFGAYLQPLGDYESLWVLSMIKSERGYWKEYESEAYRYTLRDTEVSGPNYGVP